MKSWFAFAVADGCRWINKYKNISKNILKLKDYSYIYILLYLNLNSLVISQFILYKI